MVLDVAWALMFCLQLLPFPPTAHRSPQGQPREDAEPLADGRVHPAAGPAAENHRGIKKHPPEGLVAASSAGWLRSVQGSEAGSVVWPGWGGLPR